LRAGVCGRANGPGCDIANHSAGINAGAQLTDDSEDFIVAPARINSRFNHNVGRSVLGVSRGVKCVVESAAVSGGCVPKILRDSASGGGEGREAATAEGCLRTFDGNAECQFIAEKTLRCAERISTLPGEPNDVLRIDHHWQGFLTVLNALPIFRCKTPHLAAGDGKTTIESGLRPQLALPENIAVALTIVGGGAGAEEVHFEVAGELSAADLGLGQHGGAGLASGENVFGNFAERVAGEGMPLSWVLMSALSARWR